MIFTLKSEYHNSFLFFDEGDAVKTEKIGSSRI